MIKAELYCCSKQQERIVVSKRMMVNYIHENRALGWYSTEQCGHLQLHSLVKAMTVIEIEVS